MKLKTLLLVLTTYTLFGIALYAANDQPLVTGVGDIVITVDDLDRSIEFYRDVLNFELISETELDGADYERLMGVFGLRMRAARMQLGDETIELLEFLAPEGRPHPVDSKSNDLWFQHIAIIVSDMDEAYSHLRKHKVRHASSGPQTLPEWNAGAAGIAAFYFKDPDGNVLEVLDFPPDKGDPKWHQETDDLFLGIDHTAIVVSDTEESLEFYRDALGMEIIGQGENHGIEQERLNNVFGARLQITTLRAAEGPAIEFLEYLAPSTGRAAPLDTQANDLWHWHTKLHTRSIDAIESLVYQNDYTLVSPGVIEILDDESEFENGLMVRDPDLHGMLIIGN